jgi:glycosyltransferase involved in cell wall biosynthesis
MLLTLQRIIDPDAPHVTLFYHYFHPDDVVSARHFTDLAIGLVQRGWKVTAVPCNRGCRDEASTYRSAESYCGVRIERQWRPKFSQVSTMGRLLNAAWMIAAWGVRGFSCRRHRHEVIVIGTDPTFAALAALPWKFLRPSSRVAHWCFDLYPEAPIAEGMIRESSPTARLLKRAMSAAYQRCDLIANLGPCMAERLRAYGAPRRAVTLIPWALVEPPTPVQIDPEVRRELFGAARIGLLYSGNFGLAHSYQEFLQLARALLAEDVHFCFAGRGNRMQHLRSAMLPGDTNVSFAGFAPEAELEKRLGACDLHLISLRSEWSGTVVPSKFFGALAAGRGVIFAGPPESAIGRWINEYKIGWILTQQSVCSVAAQVKGLLAEPAKLAQLRERCHQVYHEHFSRERQIDRWDAELRQMIR